MKKPDNFKSKYQKKHSGKHIESQKDIVSINYNKVNKFAGGGIGAIGSLINVGQTADKLLAPKDEYGYSDVSSIESAASGLFNPSKTVAPALQQAKQGNYGRAFIEAAIPGFGSILSNQDAKKKKDAAYLEEKKSFYIPQTNNPYEPTMSFSKYGGYAPIYKYGGQPNAEIEDDEVIEVPNGTTPYTMGGGNLQQTSDNTYTADGLTHNQGGIQTDLPNGTKIWSDKIKHSSGKTYAAVNDKLTREKGKLEKVLDDKKATKISKTTATEKLKIVKPKIEQLFAEQEQVKADKFNKGVRQLNAKYGGYQDNSSITGNPGMNNVEYKEGGKHWIQKAVKGMRKDKPCTGSKFGGPTCPAGSKRYNLAKTFRKMNHEYGGVQQMANGGLLGIPQPGYQLRDNTWQSVPFACGGKYPWGGTTPSSTGWDLGYQAPDFSTNNPYFIKGMNNDRRNGIYMPEEQGFLKGTSFGQPAGTGFNTPAPSKLDMGLGFKSADNSNWTGNTPSPYLNQFSPYANPEFSGPTSVPETATTPATGNKTNWNNIAYGVAAYAPTIYNTAKGLFDKPYQFNVNKYMSTGYEQFKPDSVNPSLNAIHEQVALTNANIAGKTTSPGQYIAGRIGLANNAMKASSNAILANQKANNLGVSAANKYNTALDAQNKSKRYTIDTANLKNRAETSEYLGKAAEGFSSIAQMNKYLNSLKTNDILKIKALDGTFANYRVTEDLKQHIIQNKDKYKYDEDTGVWEAKG